MRPATDCTEALITPVIFGGVNRPHCHTAMPTLAPEKVIDDRETVVIRVPAGTKDQLEELRRIGGHRSINATVADLFKATFAAEGI